LLGEHTDEILTQLLGYSADDVKELAEVGATTPKKKAAAE
jgi:formyl-CoA transferase